MIEENDILARKILKSSAKMGAEFELTDRDLICLFSLIIALQFIRSRSFSGRDGIPGSILDDLEKLHHWSINDEKVASLDNLLNSILHRLAMHIGAKPQLRLPHFPSGAIRKAMQLICELDDGRRSPDPQMLHGLYVHFYSRYVGQENDVDFRNSEKFSSLAKALANNRQTPWEYFISLGDFGATHEHVNFPEVYANTLPPHEFLLRLRLWLRGADLHLLKSDKSPVNAFALISHPHQQITSPPTFSHPDFPVHSALSALYGLLNGRQQIGPAIAIIPGIDRSAKGRRAAFRERLVRSGHLLAVIDIPLTTQPTRRSTTVSALFFSGHPFHRQEILCIDGTQLKSKEHSLDRTGYDADMRAIAALIGIWADDNERFEPSYLLSVESLFSTLIKRHFEEGYVDIPGLCKSVSHDQLGQADFALRATTYIKTKLDQEWLSEIDSAPIVSLINRHPAEKFRAYIIGNNGAGKSLLLRELIKYLRRAEIRAVGISFGQTDRFPFTGRISENGAFIYRGARTGKAGLNYATAATHLAKLTKRIHVDQIRLNVFDEAMEMLGFDRRHYLVPQQFSPINGEYTDRQLEDFILLTNNAAANATILTNTNHKQYQLALMRQTDKKYVAVFETLSSGEQQVLTLVIKLIAEAESNTVFLVDEPEISLHVTWQRTLPRILEFISLRLDCSIVTATHSPVIIASATRLGDHNFVAKKGSLTPLALRPSHSVDTVLFDDFETYTENSRRVHERCAAIVAQVISLINDDTKDSSRAISVLRNELQQMARIIDKSAEAVSLEQKKADLDLVRKAEAAIIEVVANEAAYFGQNSNLMAP